MRQKTRDNGQLPLFSCLLSGAFSIACYEGAITQMDRAIAAARSEKRAISVKCYRVRSSDVSFQRGHPWPLTVSHNFTVRSSLADAKTRLFRSKGNGPDVLGMSFEHVARVAGLDVPQAYGFVPGAVRG